MRKRAGCVAYQCSDQMVCPKCGVVWDMNDPEPPECKTKAATGTKVVGRAAVDNIREMLNNG